MKGLPFPSLLVLVLTIKPLSCIDCRRDGVRMRRRNISQDGSVLMKIDDIVGVKVKSYGVLDTATGRRMGYRMDP